MQTNPLNIDIEANNNNIFTPDQVQLLGYIIQNYVAPVTQQIQQNLTEISTNLNELTASHEETTTALQQQGGQIQQTVERVDELFKEQIKKEDNSKFLNHFLINSK